MVGTAAYETGKNRQASSDAQYDQGYDAAPPPPPAPPPPGPTAPADDTIAEIQQLAALHDSGALTDEEFASAKAKVIG